MPDGRYSYASAINDHGEICGSSETVNRQVHGFRFHEGTMQDLGTLGGVSSEALAINNLGQIVGSAATAEGLATAAFWENISAETLGMLPGHVRSAAYALNTNGLIVGSSTASNNVSSAVRFIRGSSPTELNALVPENTGWNLTHAWGVNRFGYIVGQGTLNGQTNGFLLVPMGSIPRLNVASETSLTLQGNPGENWILEQSSSLNPAEAWQTVEAVTFLTAQEARDVGPSTTIRYFRMRR